MSATAIELSRRFLVLAAIAFWVGGFFFYSGVVIHVGRHVLGSHRMQGFVTQQVTVWMNVASLPALAVFLWNVLATRRDGSRWLRRSLLGTWCLMAIIQVLLFWLHPVMDRFLDPPTKQIAFRPDFVRFHTVYMTLAAIQHFAGVLHLVLSMLLWRQRDVDGRPKGINGVEQKVMPPGKVDVPDVPRMTV
jgi:hypothetical protein